MWTFRAMGTEVSVVVPHVGIDEGERLARRVAAVFDEDERRFSRFLPDSELSQLNATVGPSVVSRELFDVLSRAREHHLSTAGLFDPTIGAALVEAGYDRSFARGALDRDAPAVPVARASFAEVVLDPSSFLVERPLHVQLDLGGLVKGYTVDRAARLLPESGAIDAGGDAMLRGPGPDGERWEVDVEHPRDPDRTVLTLALRDRAVATSAPNRRWWRRAGERAHHLVDPRTAAPARSDLAQVTVVAQTAERADVVAKTLFVLGASHARRFLASRPELGAVLVHAGGDCEALGAIELVPRAGGAACAIPT